MNSLLDTLEDMGAEVEDTLERLMDDEDLYIDYLKKFPDNENILELRKAIDAVDVEKAMMEVHTLKGMALNLGLLPFADICMDMLLDFREGETDRAMAQFDVVEEGFREWADVIRKD